MLMLYGDVENKPNPAPEPERESESKAWGLALWIVIGFVLIVLGIASERVTAAAWRAF